ncbi:MAG: site-specific integrase [Prolixibacteraceae bacterium]|nr:site-specific integrase [Prolixibacteraceae bacterium]
MKEYNKDLIKFNLKSSKEPNVKTQIYLIFNFNGNRLRYYTGKRIEPKYWDSIKQKAKPSYSSVISLNQFLKTTANFLEDQYNELDILKKRITIEILKEKLDNRFNTANGNNLFESFEEFLINSVNVKANSTIKRHRTTLSRLKEYCEKKKCRLSFDDIDLNFDERFKNFLIDDLKLTNNTVAKHYKTLKAFLKWATERGYNTNHEFQKLKAKQTEGEIYFLTWDELMKILEFDFNNPKLERVRDIFCFGCFTGLRFSDILNLKQENISSDTIQIQTLKTKGKTNIPLNQFSRMIYEKYKSDETYTLFQSISNQKMNQYLKEIGKLAEINEPVQIIRYSGTKRTDKVVPKYQVLTSHVARKTFITNAMIRGMSTEVIMDITTHNSYKSFKRYFKIVDDHKKDQMEKVFG